eukprot:9201446-Karenia_brevis.AAC.1
MGRRSELPAPIPLQQLASLEVAAESEKMSYAAEDAEGTRRTRGEQRSHRCSASRVRRLLEAIWWP